MSRSLWTLFHRFCVREVFPGGLTSHLTSLAVSWVGVPVGFTKALFFLCCCILSGIGVVFLTSPEPSLAVLVLSEGFLFHSLLCVVSIGLYACFCHKTTFYQLGGYDHSVSCTTAQLTEGRSARDQPKQPPAKKR